MDIKWSYYLIAFIYILVSILKVINSKLMDTFLKQNPCSIKLLALKKDFFTTVSISCIIITVFINIAAVIGNKPINKTTILITMLVVGFTYLNSCFYILLPKDKQQIFILGYLLQKGEIDHFKVKERKILTSYDITFTKEIDSYNYMKVYIFGENRHAFYQLMQELLKKS